MNKYIKTGLLLQIPNLLVASLFLSILLVFLVFRVSLDGDINILVYIIIVTLFVMVNIFSLVLLIIGIIENLKVQKNTINKFKRQRQKLKEKNK